MRHPFWRRAGDSTVSLIRHASLFQALPLGPLVLSVGLLIGWYGLISARCWRPIRVRHGSPQYRCPESQRSHIMKMALQVGYYRLRTRNASELRSPQAQPGIDNYDTPGDYDRTDDSHLRRPWCRPPTQVEKRRFLMIADRLLADRNSIHVLRPAALDLLCAGQNRHGVENAKVS